MELFTRRYLTTATLATSWLVATRLARAQAPSSDARVLLNRAYATIQEARTDPQFGGASELFQRAPAIMVVPQLVKAGFFLGGEGGNGVLLEPTEKGWSDPLFYTLASGSFGLQIGVEVAEVILFAMSDRALRAWTREEFSLGAKAGLSILVVGANASAATTANANVDIVAWAKAKGAFAGITLEGSVIKPRTEWNTAWYGRPISPAQMLRLAGR